MVNPNGSNVVAALSRLYADNGYIVRESLTNGTDYAILEISRTIRKKDIVARLTVDGLMGRQNWRLASIPAEMGNLVQILAPSVRKYQANVKCTNDMSRNP